jgi:hypothetical protein
MQFLPAVTEMAPIAQPYSLQRNASKYNFRLRKEKSNTINSATLDVHQHLMSFMVDW